MNDRPVADKARERHKAVTLRSAEAGRKKGRPPERPFFLIRFSSGDDGDDGGDTGGDDDGDGDRSGPKPEPVVSLEALEIEPAAHYPHSITVSDSQSDRANPDSSPPPAIVTLKSALLGHSLAW